MALPSHYSDLLLNMKEFGEKDLDCYTFCYTFPLESEVLRIAPIERIYKAPKYILVLVVTKYKQGCRVYSLWRFGLIDLVRLA